MESGQEAIAIKLVIVGDGVVGKTCILSTFLFVYLAMLTIVFQPSMCQLFSITQP